MDIVIDATSLVEFSRLPLPIILQRILLLFGWIPIALVFLWGAKEVWLFYIRTKWGKTQKYTILAIDIPRGNMQSPKAVENIFTYLAGAHHTLDLVEVYWEGQFQLYFSMEIVSIEGYTQFLIYTPVRFRNLAESAVYSQYPDAEITEVNDYTEGIPRKFPDEEYDIWGAEYILKNNTAYPIKTYKEFEHQFGAPEEQFKDPMASLMDLCSTLKKGEQLWYQIIVTPIGFDWMDIGDKEISRILKEKTTGKENFADKLASGFIKLLGSLSEMIYSIWGGIEEKKEEEKDDSLKMMNLKPKEKKQVEAIHDKVSKLSFEAKIRFIYAAKKEVLNKDKVAYGFTGYIKQYASLDLNNIKPDMDLTATSVSYFLKEPRVNARKTRIINNYIRRDNWAGRKPAILNIEELASLWHFPIEAVVKAPMIQKAPGRKAEPPMTLPFSEETAREEIPISETEKVDDIFNEQIIESGQEASVKTKMPSAMKLADDSSIKKVTASNKFKKEILNQKSTQQKASPPDNLPVI